MRREVQDLAGEALREYSEIMEALETKNKGGSEETEEEEEVHGGDEEEGPFAEYLNELCSQKKFVSEVKKSHRCTSSEEKYLFVFLCKVGHFLT